MAPSRRKGSGKASSAAAAAAAKRQWKVGDLVLAKVKGFPAWPATVSEPEKWGYSTDWKKVLVYFFGTKQIAFCNPADVEAFTEEKKKTLLIKRQGKGADFVRAVEEIIDCFEKSKKQDGGDEFNSGDEGTVSNTGTCEGPADKSWEKVQTKSPIIIPNSRFDSLCASADRNGSHDPAEVPAAATEFADRHDLETVSEEPIANILDHLKETTLVASNSSRKRSRDKPLQNCIVQKRAPSVRRSRSSTKVDSCKFQNLIMAVNDGSKNDNEVPNVMQGESIRRNRRIRKTLDSSVWHDMVSPVYSTACVSNGSSEDNASEIVATNSDAVSLNEGSTLESNNKTEHPDIVVDYLDRGVQVGETLHVQAKTVVVKKKRKPNRKRIAHSAAGLTSSPDKVSCLEVQENKTIPSSPKAIEKLSDRYCKADGDEHLPLVKRARVRMGKPPTEEKETNNLVDVEEKSSKEVSMNHSEPVSVPSSCSTNFLTGRTSLEVKGAENGSSATIGSTHCTENEPLFWKVKKYQLRACSVDGEAALPPSKRLHRALEAMSANAAEDVQANIENQGATMTISSNGHTSSHEKSSPHMTVDNEAENSKAGNALEVQDVKHAGDDNKNMSGRFGLVPSLTSPSSEIPAKTSSEVKSCDYIVATSINPKEGDCKESLTEARDSVHMMELDDSSFNTRSGETEVHVETSQPSSDFGEKHDSLESSPGLLIPSEPSMKEDQNGLFRPSNQCSVDILKGDDVYILPDKSDGEHGTPKTKVWSSHSVSEAETIQNVSVPNNGHLLLSVPSGSVCEDTKYSVSPSDENTKVEGMCEVVKEVQQELAEEDVDAPSYETSMKGLIAAAQAKRHLSRATSLSDNSLDDKVVSDTMPSPSLTHRIDSSEKASPHNFSICHQSTLDNGNYLLQNGSGSPDVFSHYKKTTHVLEMDKEGNLEPTVSHRQKFLGKWTSAEANAARKSFEVLLGTLSRTKESIGRATRLAIDCAKYGIAGEVVEILARSLESESSLHRRVDLFFLVDSITQCSRGQKGDVGDIYPSAVQAALPRLLSAAAPPGNSARENRRQCLKVLKLWLERKTLPESIIRHHMQELDSVADASFIGSSSRRPSRTERALNDPIREMEGMLVDEYGSNANFQLPGFFMPRMLEDEEEGSDTDEKSFEAVTPEHESEIPIEREATPTSATEKHRHILEDVDGELEMEDVAPSCVADVNSSYQVAGVDSVHNSLSQFEQHLPLPFAPPLPEDKPPTPPPLPTSPPPMASLHSLPPPPLPLPHSFVDGADSNHYVNTSSMRTRLQQQPRPQQPRTPSVNSMTSDTVNYYAPGYRDFAPQIQRPGLPSSSDPTCSFPGPHSSIQAGNNVQQIDGAPLHNKNYHLQPPPPMLSNQFSYVQADQRAQTWMEASSSSYTKRFQFGHDVHRENMYDNQDRMVLAQHEIGERCRVPPPVHPGPVHSDNTDSSYPPVPYFGPPPDTIPNREWSFPPRGLNYRHPTPLRPPEISGANGVNHHHHTTTTNTTTTTMITSTTVQISGDQDKASSRDRITGLAIFDLDLRLLQMFEIFFTGNHLLPMREISGGGCTTKGCCIYLPHYKVSKGSGFTLFR
ncbi:PWWP domain [Macleaya cordata]|uniref:PWWP domain n=1 Tax=Macleaya cordata TaxID=56857 RepID=A0A200RBI6_MACCD|nr:PWWP domain [Macleaya cordata]